MRQLPEAVAGVAPRIDAVDVLAAVEDVVVGLAGERHEVGRLAGLVDQRLEGAARVQQVPHVAGAVAGGVALGDGLALVVQHRVRGAEEGLAVVAQVGEAVLQHAEHQLVGVRLHGAAHLGHQRGVDAVGVVLDGGARHAHGQFERLVLDGVAVQADGVHHAVAQPFAQPGQLAQPAVLFGGGGAGHGGGDLAVLAGGLAQAGLEGGVERDEKRFQVGVVDKHGGSSKVVR